MGVVGAVVLFYVRGPALLIRGVPGDRVLVAVLEARSGDSLWGFLRGGAIKLLDAVIY